MSEEIQLEFKEFETRDIGFEGSNHNGPDDALT
jgi:hypothetical protein